MTARTLLSGPERRRGLTAWSHRGIAALLFLLTVTTVGPLVWLAGNAFKSPEEYRGTPLALFPHEASLVVIPDAQNRGTGKIQVEVTDPDAEPPPPSRRRLSISSSSTTIGSTLPV